MVMNSSFVVQRVVLLFTQKACMNAHLENRKPEIVYNQCTGFENSYHLMAKINILSAADLHKNTFACFL